VTSVRNVYVQLHVRHTLTSYIVFDPPSSNLTYSGIYRFLNNPERVLGLAGVWGVAFITWNVPVFYLAATAHILNLAFLQFVERPHMQRYLIPSHTPFGVQVGLECFAELLEWRRNFDNFAKPFRRT